MNRWNIITRRKDKENEKKMQAIFSVILGIVLIISSFYIHKDLILWEQTGGTRRINIIFYALYQILGASAAFFVLIPTGLYMFYNACKLLKVSDKE